LRKKPRVLIADDHPDLVKAITRVLTLDYEVVGVVSDGSAVLDAAQRLQPDVVVVDLNLPNVNGLEACRQITRAVPDTKVIVFTAMDDPFLRQRALEAGASAFVCKVASDSDLLATINRLFAERG
jgi:DNA-binding NarL/FixJ family response regulator